MNYKPFIAQLNWVNTTAYHDITAKGYNDDFQTLFFYNPGATPSQTEEELEYADLLPCQISEKEKEQAKMQDLKLAGFRRTVKKINALGPAMEKLKEEEMREKTEELKGRTIGGDPLDKLLPEAFALVREAAKRMLGYGHYDVQLLGGIALHKEYLAEMKTGEGRLWFLPRQST